VFGELRFLKELTVVTPNSSRAFDSMQDGDDNQQEPASTERRAFERRAHERQDMLRRVWFDKEGLESCGKRDIWPTLPPDYTGLVAEVNYEIATGITGD
jgi:hypothetical protein